MITVKGSDKLPFTYALNNSTTTNTATIPNRSANRSCQSHPVGLVLWQSYSSFNSPIAIVMNDDSMGFRNIEHSPMIRAVHTKCNSLSEGTPRKVAAWATNLRIVVFSLFILDDWFSYLLRHRSPLLHLLELRGVNLVHWVFEVLGSFDDTFRY